MKLCDLTQVPLKIKTIRTWKDILQIAYVNKVSLKNYETKIQPYSTSIL